MKNSEGKKQGFMSKLTVAFFGDMDRENDRHLQMARQWAQETCKTFSAWGMKANITGEQGKTVIFEITDSPVQWIHLQYYTDKQEDSPPHDAASWYFVVPDSRHLPKLKIRTIAKRTYNFWKSAHGEVIDLHWKGNDRGTGISRDQDITVAIMSLMNCQLKRSRHFINNRILFLNIRSELEVSEGIIKIETGRDTRGWVIEPDLPVYNSQEEWHIFESIATRLLKLAIPEY
ncbi:MAG: hypothetical protein V1767_00635 [Chloroflexota bacterium]